jgi:HK97 family phage major capsid protein
VVHLGERLHWVRLVFGEERCIAQADDLEELVGEAAASGSDLSQCQKRPDPSVVVRGHRRTRVLHVQRRLRRELAHDARLELRADEAVELDAYLAFELGGRLGALQETAFCTGDGSGKPLGLVHASSTIPVITAATGSNLLYKLADLVAVVKALPSGYRANASWLINADDFASLAGTADTAGGLVFPSLQFDPPSLFGRPVLIADLPAPAANAKSLVFGDFKRAYGIRRVNGVTLTRQDEIHADSGQIGFKALARVDGRVLIADAARILAHSAT